MSDETKEKAKETETPQESTQESLPKQKEKNPMIRLTQVILLVALIIFIWYIFSDINTPYTNHARVTEIVVPVVPRVSGYLTEVNVKLHSKVKAGDFIFLVDTMPYSIAVSKAKANLDNVIQQLGAQSEGVKAAASNVGMAKAQLDRAQRNYDRVFRIIKKNPGALSQKNIDQVETSLDQAKEKLQATEADLIQAKKALGAKGNNNAQLRMAIEDLYNAELQLEWTKVYAPVDGHIESFNLDVGYFAQAGKPLATVVSKEDIWIQANYTENNISKMKAGEPVLFIMDIAPGKVFKGEVSSIGYGVETDNRARPGDLPRPETSKSWLQEPQRFPVIITMKDTTAIKISRAGGQVTVVAFNGHHPVLNAIAKFRIWINTYLSYVR